MRGWSGTWKLYLAKRPREQGGEGRQQRTCSFLSFCARGSPVPEGRTRIFYFLFGSDTLMLPSSAIRTCIRTHDRDRLCRSREHRGKKIAIILIKKIEVFLIGV